MVVLPIWVMNLAVSREKNHSMNTFAALSCRLLAGRLPCQRSAISSTAIKRRARRHGTYRAGPSYPASAAHTTTGPVIAIFMSSSGKDSEPNSWVKVIDVRRSSQHKEREQTIRVGSFFAGVRVFSPFSSLRIMRACSRCLRMPNKTGNNNSERRADLR